MGGKERLATERIKTCQKCKEEYITKGNNSKYCNTCRKTANEEKRNPNTECFVCKKKIYRSPSSIQKSEHTFCSNKCVHQHRYNQKVKTIEKNIKMDIKEFLYNEYINKNLPTSKIGAKIGLSKDAVLRLIKNNNIEIKDRSTAISSQWVHNDQRKKFTSNLARKNLNKKESRDRLRLVMNTNEYKQKISKANKGENNGQWKGGITNIIAFLRNHITDWKKESIKTSKYKCVITGSDFNVVHHIYGFDLILEDVFKETNIVIKSNIADYNEFELEVLIKKCQEIHNKYPLGVCLNDDIHKLFHSIYGYGHNTPEQFEDFKQRYLSGEFDQYIEQAK